MERKDGKTLLIVRKQSKNKAVALSVYINLIYSDIFGRLQGLNSAIMEDFHGKT